LRRLLKPPHERHAPAGGLPLVPAGRWSLLRPASSPVEAPAPDAVAEFVARRLLDRYGVVFRRILVREKIPIPWRDIVRVLRCLELRGDARGGRFVAGFAGEQYASPGAVELLRRVKTRPAGEPAQVAAGDPLNLQGILTPDERIASSARRRVKVG
ncbi:MAG TPA: DEAD/DEAH box helicase, partial [Verrucomicrobiae bacterium]|nr:DEAD/DEAH box helicase [Verrucomicrobiae bacterium]